MIRFEADGTNMMCLRAMTGAIILFDHLHAQGAFIRKSPINVKALLVNIINTFKDKGMYKCLEELYSFTNRWSLKCITLYHYSS